MSKRVKVQNTETKIVNMGTLTPRLKIIPSEVHMIKMPHKSPIKQKMLRQTPVGMSNTQTSAKFIPVAHRPKEKKL